jgi:hypothetical protein
MSGHTRAHTHTMSRGQGVLPIVRPEPPGSVITAICQRAGCGKPLIGRQATFCGDLHRAEAWAERHPRLNTPIPPKDQPKIPIRDRILGLMSDRQWRTDFEIAQALGLLEQTAGAKRRDLCKPAFGACVFEGRKSSRPYSPKCREFRLVKP